MYVKDKNYLSLVLWIICLMVISSGMGFLTKNNISSWYVDLVRSPLTPPNYVFSIVWSILYAMIATSGWMIWRAPLSSQLDSIKKLYIAQLLLNWLWTPLFFHYHFIGSALICLLIIVVLVGILIKNSHKNIQLVAVLLTPYFLWCLFALYLNLYIWLYN